MSPHTFALLCVLCASALSFMFYAVPFSMPSVVSASAIPQGKDYLTPTEADKIREAEFPDARIKLFVDFAADRLAKLKYELARGRLDRQRNVRLLSLLDAYMGCLDDAAELTQIGRMRQQDILKAIADLHKRAAEFLVELETLEKAAAPDAAYKEELHEAIQSTKEALAEADKAKEEIAPPPVRRKP